MPEFDFTTFADEALKTGGRIYMTREEIKRMQQEANRAERKLDMEMKATEASINAQALTDAIKQYQIANPPEPTGEEKLAEMRALMITEKMKLLPKIVAGTASKAELEAFKMMGEYSTYRFTEVEGMPEGAGGIGGGQIPYNQLVSLYRSTTTAINQALNNMKSTQLDVTGNYSRAADVMAKYLSCQSMEDFDRVTLEIEKGIGEIKEEANVLGATGFVDSADAVLEWMKAIVRERIMIGTQLGLFGATLNYPMPTMKPVTGAEEGGKTTTTTTTETPKQPLPDHIKNQIRVYYRYLFAPGYTAEQRKEGRRQLDLFESLYDNEAIELIYGEEKTAIEQKKRYNVTPRGQ